ncbi:hypothetical protein D3C77_345000 [compost metagenome]
MKAGSYRTEDACGLIIPVIVDHLYKRVRSFGALHQQGPAIMGQYRSGTLSFPPGHEQVAGLLFRFL